MGWQDDPVAAPVAAQGSWKDDPVVTQGAPTTSEPPVDVGRQIALGGRAAGEGVFGALSSVAENTPASMITRILTGRTPQQLGTALTNRLFGTHIVAPQSSSQMLSDALTRAGAPTPSTPGEQLASAGIRGATGALALGGLGGVTGVPNAIRAGASGATGSLASEYARQQGAGPGGQTLAGLVGGFAPSALEEGARAAGRVASNIVSPLTRTGQENIAGRVLATQATDPQAAAANLDAAQPVIPNSPRNAGEASQDLGLLALEKGLRGRNPADFGQRISEQNAARQAELANVAGTPADLAAAIKNRSDVTGPMREQALGDANANTIKFQDLADTIENRFRSKASALQDKGRFDTFESQNRAATQDPYTSWGLYKPRNNRVGEGASASADMDPIIAQRQQELSSAQTQLEQLKASGASPLEISKVSNRIQGILQTPGLRASQVVQKALGGVRDKLGELASENGTIDARDLYTVRKEIGSYIQTAAKESGNWDKRLASGLQMDVQHSIDDAIEGAAPGFKAYLERYKEMSQPIDQMKVMQEIQKRSQLAGSADITTGQSFIGNAAFSRALDSAIQKSGQKLTPDQIERLNAIRTDLQYGQAINSPLIKAPGSDTFQNLSIAQAIGMGGNAAHPIAQVLTKPLAWVYKLAGTDKSVNDVLVHAMLDPKLASAMLKRATPASVGAFSGRLRAATLGVSGGLAGSRQQSTAPPAEAQSTQ